jgi:hypothetical protein
MKAKRIFRPQIILAAAQAGELNPGALRKAIEVAEEFGNVAAAEQLRAYLPRAKTTPKRT